MTRNQVAFIIASLGVVLWATMLAVGAASPAQLTRQDVPGVRNMTQVEPTIACAGATDASAIPEIAKRGYKSIISLRLASETGANIDEARSAAARAGVIYIHLPFDIAKPDETVVDRFIAAVSNTANHPTFVHCGSANRVAGLWLIKRVMADGWDSPRAEAEARTIGLSSPAMRDFALQQVAKRKRH